MKHVKISATDSSTEESSVDIENLKEAEATAKRQAQEFMAARRVIGRITDRELDISAPHNNIWYRDENTTYDTLYKALLKDYKGNEQKLIFNFGSSGLKMRVSNLDSQSADIAESGSREIEVTPQNMEDLVKLMTASANTGADSKDISATIINQLKSGLDVIAQREKREKTEIAMR